MMRILLVFLAMNMIAILWAGLVYRFFVDKDLRGPLNETKIVLVWLVSAALLAYGLSGG